MSNYYRVHEVAELLNVSTSSVRRYVSNGLLECSLTPSNQRIFTQEQVDKFLGVEKTNQKELIKVYYARSSEGNKLHLEQQINQLIKTYGNESAFIITDNGSGLNDKRKGLQRLFKLARENKITDIYITNPDRLTRFGYSYLIELFNQNNVTLHYLSEENKSLEDELLNDFMSLIASFSGKYYRLRSFKNQHELLNTAQKALHEKAE